MGFVTEVMNSMFKILQGFVPIGVDPIYFWLTFIIAFAMIFLILIMLPFFQESRGLAGLVALVISYFTASSAFVTIIIAKLFPNVGLVIMGILGIMLVVGLLAPNSFDEGMIAAPFILIVAVVIILWLTYSFVAPELQAAGFISEGLGTSIGSEDVAMVIAALIVIGIVFSIMKPANKGESAMEKAFKGLFKKGL